MTKEQFQTIRMNHKLTQKALATLLHVDNNYVYMLESGRRPITHLMSMALHSLEHPKRKSA